MKLGKAAAPYGGGRVVSLFAHKKYDTLTLDYVDSDGGVHGAIFEVTKGQGELVKNELVARGVSSSPGEDQPTKQASRRSRMKTSKRNSWIFCVAACVTIAVALSGRLAGQTAALKPSDGSSGSGTQWSLQVERIDPGTWNWRIPSKSRSTKTSWKS